MNIKFLLLSVFCFLTALSCTHIKADRTIAAENDGAELVSAYNETYEDYNDTSCEDVVSNYEFYIFAFSASKKDFQRKMRLTDFPDHIPTPENLCKFIRTQKKDESADVVARQILMANDEIVKAFEGTVAVKKGDKTTTAAYRLNPATSLRLFTKRLLASNLTVEQLKNKIILEIKDIERAYKITKNKAGAYKLYTQLYPENAAFEFNSDLNKCMLIKRNQGNTLMQTTSSCGIRVINSPPNIWWAEDTMDLDSTPSKW